MLDLGLRNRWRWRLQTKTARAVFNSWQSSMVSGSSSEATVYLRIALLVPAVIMNLPSGEQAAKVGPGGSGV